MKPNYVIINEDCTSGFIVVSNYQTDNEIHNWGHYETEKELKREKEKSDIGFWKLKKQKS